MDTHLTDRLCCPRCGPGFGLVLLASRVQERRVLEGAFGCPNCRDRFPVEEGVGDLRPPPRAPLGPTGRGRPPRPASSEELERLGALLGVFQGPASLALLGSLASCGAQLADRLDDVEVIGMVREDQADEVAIGSGWEQSGVSRAVIGPLLPVQTGTLDGVALGGADADWMLAEAIRAARGGARIVILAPAPEHARTLREAGLKVLLEDSKAVVAATIERGGRRSAGIALPVVSR